MPLPLGLVADLSSGQGPRGSRAGSSASVARAGSQDSQRSAAGKGTGRQSTTLEAIALLDGAANASKRMDHAVSSLMELVTALHHGGHDSSGTLHGRGGELAVESGSRHQDSRVPGGPAQQQLPDGASTPRPDDVKPQSRVRGPY